MPPGQTRSPSGDRGVPWASPRCRRTSAGEVGTPGPFRGGPALRVIAGAERDRPPPAPCRSPVQKNSPGAHRDPGPFPVQIAFPMQSHPRCSLVSRCRLIPVQVRPPPRCLPTPGADRFPGADSSRCRPVPVQTVTGSHLSAQEGINS